MKPMEKSDRPTLAQVHAWLDAHPDASGADVARHFGMAESTARRWTSAYKRQLEAGPVAHPKRPPSARVPKASELVPEARELIRSAIDSRLEWLANPENIGVKGERDVAITLGILADKWGDVIQAREGNSPTEASAKRSLARLRHALGLPADDDHSDTPPGLGEARKRPL